MILAASTQRSIGIVIAAIVLIGFITYLYFNIRSARPEIGSEIELAANRKPYLSDEELETSKLDRSLLLGLVLLAIIGIGLPAYWLAEPARQERALAGMVRKAATNGGEEYAAACQSCHGPEGSGGVTTFTLTDEATGKFVSTVTWKAPALTTVLSRFDEDEVRFILNYGRGVMPAWGGPGGGPLTEQQIDDLVVYMRTIQLPEEKVAEDVMTGVVQQSRALVLERNPRLQTTLDQAKAKQAEVTKEFANAPEPRKTQVLDQAKANVKSAEDDITAAVDAFVERISTAPPNSADFRLYGQMLFDNPAGSGQYNCARCHTKGWSYDGEDVKDRNGRPIFPLGLTAGGGWFGPNLTNGSTLRQFETPQTHIDFIDRGSRIGVKYGQYGQGSGRMPGFGARVDDSVDTTYAAILTPEQIAAIVAYERSL
jgi:mono/diheme cytochrome c family protein